jgi:hypothetical protein
VGLLVLRRRQLIWSVEAPVMIRQGILVACTIFSFMVTLADWSGGTMYPLSRECIAFIDKA